MGEELVQKEEYRYYSQTVQDLLLSARKFWLRDPGRIVHIRADYAIAALRKAYARLFPGRPYHPSSNISAVKWAEERSGERVLVKTSFDAFGHGSYWKEAP